ncbi:uncharacterized protein LOC142317428 isoform X2 [Lycorma delicatula]|uniref:uncharacterized protein LOC142317428 isoform X2 n=1 Tax=Lycorma delicatula TaxID=130591 RepID=UPI003F512E0C
MINLLNENISPLAIRNTLHTILNNCSKKRIPVKKTNSLKKLSNPAGGENDGHINYSNINGNYNDDDNDDDNRGNDDNGDDDCESITCGYSMASRYLLENVAYANQNCGGWTYSLRKTGK